MHSTSSPDNRFTRFRPVLFLIAFCCFPGLARTPPDSVPLNNWRFIHAHDSTMHAKQVPAPGNDAHEVTVPHTCNVNKTVESIHKGTVLYSTELRLPTVDRDSELVVLFGGVSLRAVVFINGERAGTSGFPYLPFEIPIPPKARDDSTMTLTVAVNNVLRPNDIPDTRCDGWLIYGGLIREVTLIRRSRKRITDVTSRTYFLSDSSFVLGLDYRVTSGRFDSVVLEITSSSGELLYKKANRNVKGRAIRLDTIQQVTPWSPCNPHLYTYTLRSYENGRIMHTHAFKRGFAQLTAEGNRLRLNGESIYLRGIGRHDVRGNKGPILTREERKNDLVRIKKLHANFVRSGHYPQHDDVYELCDSLGLLVMDEIPAWKTSSSFLISPEGIELGVQYCREMVRAHGNYTCVGIWSVGNEFQSFKKSLRAYVKPVADSIRAWDNSRLTTFCSYFYQFDQCYNDVDVVAVNEYFGWHLGSLKLLTPMLKGVAKDWPDKPLIVSEFGASSIYGRRNENAKLATMFSTLGRKDPSEDHQAMYIQAHINEIWKNRDICTGMNVWSFSDFFENRTRDNLPGMPNGLNTMGILNRFRHEKMSYKVVGEMYRTIADTLR